jgi:hypothetical protein
VFSHWGIMGQAHYCFLVFFLYHYLADHFAVILHSRIWRSPFCHQHLVFHEIANITIFCFHYWEWLRTKKYELFLLRTDNCSLVRRSLLTYNNVVLRTGLSLIVLLSWTVSRWDA